MMTGGAVPGMSSEEIRATVRAVLREVLPAAGPPSGGEPTEPVSVHTDGDLDALVRRVAQLCDDPAQRAALRAGRHAFRLAAGGSATLSPPLSGQVMRVDRGAVTERKVKEAATAGARLIVGRKALLTPLARERAQALGVVVEREH